MAVQACADLNNMSYVRSRGSIFPYPVTPQNMFRGQINPNDGALQGPYISQFLLQPTMFGVQPLSQMFQRFLSVSEGGADYLTNPTEYLAVESGYPPSASLQFDSTYRYVRMGRDMTAYTHVDALHQEYFIAGLVLAGHRMPGQPWQPICRLAQRTRLRHLWQRQLTSRSCGRCGNHPRDGHAGVEGGVVPQVDCEPAAASGRSRLHWCKLA